MEQLELLYNKRDFALNLLEPLSDKKTVIVLGLAGEKGASRIAGDLQYLVVSIGDNLSTDYEDLVLSRADGIVDTVIRSDSTDYEDLVLSRAVEQNQAEDIASFITKKNTELSVWGWKPPSGIKYVEAWHGKFRDSYYIVVFRDLLSIAHPNSTSTSNDVISKIRDANLYLKSLAVAFNDVDFCLMVQKAGYRNLWTSYAERYHHKSLSRGQGDSPEKQARFQSEVAFMQTKWYRHLAADPYYSPNLSSSRVDFSIVH